MIPEYPVSRIPPHVLKSVADNPPKNTEPGYFVDECTGLAAQGRQLGDIGRQPFGILSAPRDLALRLTMLPQRRTGAALGDMQMRSDMLDAGATMRGA